ncbi:DUF2567 domain-containing protein [Nocardia jejuensis]|uniref:DUF2567 domain-containing protein n=1 Tax=Nocardia jejuensis TaxID=328049 RepID=UPI0008354EE4|nr:DUF2567 domain-containing protein [Nocardia jejuensis]
MATAFAATDLPRRQGGPLLREVRAAGIVFVSVVAVSALAGVVWAYLAPAEQLLVVEPDRGSALTGESAHRFDSLAIFVLTGIVLGVLTAAATWRWRRARGPLLLIGLLLGSGAGTVVARLVGEAVAEQLHARPAHPAIHSIVEFAPTIDGLSVLIVQPLFAALAILIMTALSTSDDLGSGHRAPFGADPENAAGPGQFGSEISYGPYPGAPQGYVRQDPVVPFQAPGEPESDPDR